MVIEFLTQTSNLSYLSKVEHKLSYGYRNRFLREARIGAHGAGETPVLIPNTEVKPSSGDYTAQVGN